MSVQVIKTDREDRVESGPVMFEYRDGYHDWCGVFFRGDDALGYAFALEKLLAGEGDFFAEQEARSLLDQLQAVREP